ncbi:MAG: ABC transporter ATP-binding protein/permease [Arenicellaceae bacterium]|nr:ABC transporter ATP-binding protein/permease [Arenicellaceae bacterium]
MRPLRTEMPDENIDLRLVKRLLPYLWKHRYRVTIALTFLILAKLANVLVPIALKNIVDSLDSPPDLVVLPIGLLLAYGALRFSTTLFQELRNAVFARAAQRTTRELTLDVFRHLHELSMRFHLDRQTGGVSRDLERGSQSVSRLLNYLTFSVVPTLFELLLVCGILFTSFEISFALVTIGTILIYGVYTIKVTQWRLKYRIKMNKADSAANTAAIDSLLNYETVKYFGNEGYEFERYNSHLLEWESDSVKSQLSLALLNVGQGAIIAGGLIALMIMAAASVATGEITIGEFVMLNAFMIQLVIPLNFLGTIFREIKHCLVDMARMFGILDEPLEIKDIDNVKKLSATEYPIIFDKVSFSYRPDRQILSDVSFEVPAGKRVAVVGPSGSGKSTIARLLFRFYQSDSGVVSLSGVPIDQLRIRDLRDAIGVVPQDSILFNDTLAYNIAYGRPGASESEVLKAIEKANLSGLLARLPDGLETDVGERGLKLSGGEKQRVAIARAIIKDPPVLILDEATSSLDSISEQAIQSALDNVSRQRTTLVIAHRLSTVIDADRIYVLDAGKIVESGAHDQLLASRGQYHQLWKIQQEQAETVIG